MSRSLATIVSASRRTDLPGFHADWLADRLAAMRRPPGALFVWTKHPGAAVRRGPLRDVLGRLPNVIVHLTVTGLGGSALEPGAPIWGEAVSSAADLAGLLGGDPRRIVWRYDPVIPGRSSLDVFRRVADRMSSLGVRRCVSSFLSSMALKGSLLPQYAGHGIRTSGIVEKVDWAGALLECSRDAGIRWQLCCQPKVVERLEGGVEAAACIDAELAGELHPERLDFAAGRDATQRRHCRCARSLDIGSYVDHPCRTGCVYCYSRAGGPAKSDSRPARNC